MTTQSLVLGNILQLKNLPWPPIVYQTQSRFLWPQPPSLNESPYSLENPHSVTPNTVPSLYLLWSHSSQPLSFWLSRGLQERQMDMEQAGRKGSLCPIRQDSWINPGCPSGTHPCDLLLLAKCLFILPGHVKHHHFSSRFIESIVWTLARPHTPWPFIMCYFMLMVLHVCLNIPVIEGKLLEHRNHIDVAGHPLQGLAHTQCFHDVHA